PPLHKGTFNFLPWIVGASSLSAITLYVVRKYDVDIVHSMDVSLGAIAGLVSHKVAPHPSYLLRYGGDFPYEVACLLKPEGWDPKKGVEASWNLPDFRIKMAYSLQVHHSKIYDFMLPNTRHGEKLLLHMGVPPHKIRLVPYGVNTEKFSPTTDGRELKSKFISPIILTGGRMDPWKGFDVLLKAVSIVQEDLGSVSVIILGEGHDKNNLQKLASDMGIAHAHFPGAVQHDMLPRFLAAADVFVSPSFSNIGFPNILLEAMASGKPIISSRIPGVEEYLEHLKTGVLFQPGNIEELAHHIKTLLQDQKTSRKIGINARRLTLEKFSWDKMMERLLAVYDEALNRP
ncbi:MAG: glycosyltransferase family 4 protein, partial [Methanocellales archaeon]|nr:glycosyltransferase family 4 protein [Methanocellales archaeon]